MRDCGRESIVVGTLTWVGVMIAAYAVFPGAGHWKADAARSNDLPTLLTAAKTYYLKHGEYPRSMVALVDDRILDKLPSDPWKHPYRYSLDRKPVFTTSGADGVPGTADDISTNDLK
jgi:hypothetical protein